mgnify:CR=1 FL=1
MNATLHDLHRPLGSTGLSISPLGLGTVKLGRDQGVKYPNGFSIPDDAQACQLLTLARELGINLIDTAPAYGVSEERLGPLLAGQREDWVIVSKVGEEFENGQSRFDFSATHTRFSVERSLKRLRTDRIELVLDRTPLYAESGGQISDVGSIVGTGASATAKAAVTDVQKIAKTLFVHRVTVESGEFVEGDTVTAAVDPKWRHGATQGHSGTHMVHAALRQVLGPNAVQAGSLNRPGYLRFDFSATKGLSDSLKDEIEERCNVAIHDDFEVTDTQMPLEDAKAMGAMAMFGEKYPPIVRVVELAGPWSRELCGGTHVASTGRIGMLSLLGEQSVGSGTRRVEALVSTDAFRHMAAERTLVNELTGILKVQPDQLADRVSKLVTDLKDAERKLAAARTRELMSQVDDIVAGATSAGSFDFIAAKVPGVVGNDLRTLASEVRGRVKDRPAVVTLIGGTDDKPAMIVAATESARAAGAKAGALIKAGIARIGGRGGGRDDMAQGAGSDSAGIDAALRAVDTELTAL